MKYKDKLNGAALCRRAARRAARAALENDVVEAIEGLDLEDWGIVDPKASFEATHLFLRELEQARAAYRGEAPWVIPGHAPRWGVWPSTRGWWKIAWRLARLAEKAETAGPWRGKIPVFYVTIWSGYGGPVSRWVAEAIQLRN